MGKNLFLLHLYVKCDIVFARLFITIPFKNNLSSIAFGSMNLESPFKLEQITIRPAENLIEFDDGVTVTVQPKFIEVLAYLAQQYPRSVERTELIDAVWDGNHFVGEKSLNNAIWKLRHELKRADSSFIETVRKKGYRLLIEPDFDIHKSKTKNEQPAFSVSAFLSNRIVIASIVFLLVSVALLTYFFVNNSAPSQQIENITNDPGREVYAAVSPNNEYVVYSWRRIGQPPNLYIKNLQRTEVAPQQITHSDDYESRALWHPNGETIYFQRKQWNYEHCEIIELEISSLEENVVALCIGELDFSLAMSADGRTLSYMSREPGALKAKVHLLDLHSKQSKPLYTCDSCDYHDMDAAFSPNGNYIAVSRSLDNGLSDDIYIFDSKTNALEKIVSGAGDVKGMTWHADNSHIIFGTSIAKKRHGFIVNIHTKEKKSLGIEGFSYPSNIPNSNDVIFHDWHVASHLSAVAIDSDIASAPFPLIKSAFSYHSAHYSTITKRLAYISNESGFDEIWTSNIDGTERVKLTAMASHLAFPRWSPDGKHIAFLAPNITSNTSSLYVLNVNSQVIKKVTSNLAQHFRPSWRSDNKAIFAAANDGNKRGLYAFNIDNNQVTQLLDEKVEFAKQDTQGIIWFTPGRNQGLYQFEIGKGIKQILSPEQFAVTYNWEMTNDGIYFQKDYPSHHQINFYNKLTKQITPLVKLPIGTIERVASMTILPEQKKVVFTQLDFPNADVKRLRLSAPLN